MRCVAALVVLLLWSQLTGTSGPGGSSKTQTEEEAVLEAQKAYGDALTSTDVGALNRIWTFDYSFGNANGVERSREECLRFLKATAA